jgi:putative ABC transport system permease protein
MAQRNPASLKGVLSALSHTHIPMFRNYLIIGWRNLTGQKVFSLINIFGLATGLACTILIAMWVRDELSYDKFHAGYDRTYRIIASLEVMPNRAAVSPAPLGPAIALEVPGVEEVVRTSSLDSDIFQRDEQVFRESRVLYADSNFFNVFSFEMLEGDPSTALDRPDAIMLTQAMAIKYFGTATDIVGKSFTKNRTEELIVTALLADPPGNTHLLFDFVQPMTNLARTNDDFIRNVWDNFNYYTYVKFSAEEDLSPGAIAALEESLRGIYAKNEPELKVRFHLQPMADIHLTPGNLGDVGGHGNRQNVYIFIVVAFFILGVASINFMNLATARAVRRAKEVGLRKVAGALRVHLVRQFLTESIVVSTISFFVAILIVVIALPYFNELSGKSLGGLLLEPSLIAALLGVTLLTGLLAGSYPAFFLSRFMPAVVLKGALTSGSSGSIFRNIMVVIQFTVSIALIVGTSVVYQQLAYIRERNPGYDKENLLYVRMRGDIWSKYDAFRNRLSEDTLTSVFAFTQDLPTDLTSATVSVHWQGKDPDAQPLIYNIAIDDRCIEVLGVKLLSGRNFYKDSRADTNNLIVNETMLKMMGIGLDSAVGQPIEMWGRAGEIIGVVKDFNFKPVQQAIEPMVLRLNTWGGYAIVRTRPGEISRTVERFKDVWDELSPGEPFEYDFLDQELAALYKSEQRLGTLFNIFAILAIIISCLGLYGLSAYLAERRSRELGIRKVLGASGTQLVYLLSATFARPIIIAMVIATPLAWYAMTRWLAGFAYRIDIQWPVFLIAFLAALAVAMFTVSYESIKAAVKNPVGSLRSE